MYSLHLSPRYPYNIINLKLTNINTSQRYKEELREERPLNKIKDKNFHYIYF